MSKKTKPLKGGEFIIRNILPNEIFIPETWNEEQRMIATMCEDFISSEVNPNIDRIEEMEDGLMPLILEKAGELGLLGMTVPENLGRMGLDFKTSLLAAEKLAWGFSFSVAYGAQTGIRTLPIPLLWY